MELRRLMQLSNYSPQNISVDCKDSVVRQPLSVSTGNAQLYTLASGSSHHDSKGGEPRERPMYSIPMEQSQPSAPRNRPRRSRIKWTREIIEGAEQYQNYRKKQEDDSSKKEQKWPDLLEDAFLDALCHMPAMGRAKFAFEGKLHGRNEMISRWLKIVYERSLPAGATPDEKMYRDRKQVSSHIQVVKKFFVDHPCFQQVFPPEPKSKSGFQPNYKHHPVLVALANGRLPTDNMHENGASLGSSRNLIKPVVFWVLITSSGVPERLSGASSEEDFFQAQAVTHRPTSLSIQIPNGSIESLSKWRHRFPLLHQLSLRDSINCEIIHMNSSLELLKQHPAPGSELYSRIDLSIPGQYSERCRWRTITTLYKPPELYQDPEHDLPVEKQESTVAIVSTSATDTQIKIPFPATAWTYAFTCLTNIKAKCERFREACEMGIKTGPPPKKWPNEYVEQISMYQEVQCSDAPGMPYNRRAIIVWTFHQAKGSGVTTWRYLSPPSPPQRDMCMSPTPHPSHQINASMRENFNSWAEAPPHLHQLSMLDSYAHGLAAPRQTAGFHSPTVAPGYNYPGQSFQMPGQSDSFISNSTLNSRSSLVNEFQHTQLAEFEQNMYSDWPPISTGESFDTDPTWANYNLPLSTPALSWGNESKDQALVDLQDVNVNDSDFQKDWVEVRNEMGKHTENYVSHRPLPWIEEHSHIQQKENFGQIETMKDEFSQPQDVPVYIHAQDLKDEFSQPQNVPEYIHGQGIKDEYSQPREEVPEYIHSQELNGNFGPEREMERYDQMKDQYRQAHDGYDQREVLHSERSLDVENRLRDWGRGEADDWVEVNV